MAKERDESNIDDLEKTAEQGASVPPPEKNGWGSMTREDDQFSGKDKEPSIRLYRLYIGNEPMLSGDIHPAFRKLCLDRDLAIQPRDMIRAILLERRYTRCAQIPYDKRDKLPKDDHTAKYIGYSHDGVRPSVNSLGEPLMLCINQEHEKPFLLCSGDSVYKDNEVQVTPLIQDNGIVKYNDKEFPAVGECPYGRWGNTLTPEDQAKYKIADEDAPKCPSGISAYLWDLDLAIPLMFEARISSYKSMAALISTFTVGMGEQRRKLEFYTQIIHISVEDRGNYAIPKFINTRQPSSKSEVQPVVDWWAENNGMLIRDRVHSIEDYRKKKEEAESFKIGDL